MELFYSGKLYVELNGERVVGPGRVELLEKIQATGSIRQAAKEMKMSYRQAWQHIDHMNTYLGSPVVHTERGGSGGGQTKVTATGMTVIKEFKAFHEKFHEFLKANRFQLDSSS